MNAIAKKFLKVSVLAVAAAHAGAGAQALNDGSLAWIENQSFGFEACAALAEARASEDAAGTLAALRGSAAGQLGEAVRLAGVPLGAAQHLTMTPVEGRFACGARASEVTFRVAAVDRSSGKFWTADLTVRADEAPADRGETVALADGLARSFRGVVLTQSTLR